MKQVITAVFFVNAVISGCSSAEPQGSALPFGCQPTPAQAAVPACSKAYVKVSRAITCQNFIEGSSDRTMQMSGLRSANCIYLRFEEDGYTPIRDGNYCCFDEPLRR